ncbi:MAG: DNA-processing protein DprA [Muribaculaceae bacterium]|nr:DNA-processing protein DprA [Muribaculaceae bacterium]
MAFTFLSAGKVKVWRMLEEAGVSVNEFFSLDKETIAGRIGLTSTARLPGQDELDRSIVRAGMERQFMERHGVHACFIENEDYPWRLRDIPDAPLILYALGEFDFSSDKVLSIVGTRRSTPYGHHRTTNLVEELGKYFPDLCIVSGLAYGIDAMAHTAALDAGLPTVGVLAHGLDTIYPSSHRDLAKRMVKNGGALLTEYPSGVTPYRKNFLERNRIVAGLAEVTVVVESAIKGGALSTANDAYSYGREVVAFPGRVGDEQSEGCNRLISRGKAKLVTGASDIMELTGWHPLCGGERVVQRRLFPELEGTEKIIYEAVSESVEPVSPDRIHILTGLPVSEVMTALSEMEFNGYVLKFPGNRFAVS